MAISRRGTVRLSTSTNMLLFADELWINNHDIDRPRGFTLLAGYYAERYCPRIDIVDPQQSSTPSAFMSMFPVDSHGAHDHYPLGASSRHSSLDFVKPLL